MQHAHTGKRRFTDLRCADKVEIADRAHALRALSQFRLSEAPLARCRTGQMEPVADMVLAMAEIARRLNVCDKTTAPQMRVLGADAINHGPELTGNAGAVCPIGEECACIGKGQRYAQIHAHQSVARNILAQQIPHFRARPATFGRAQQARRATIRIGKRQSDALVPLPLGA